MKNDDLDNFEDGIESSINNTFEQENSLDYLPNELRFSSKFTNETAEAILNSAGSENEKLNKNMLTDFFRGITLCHQASVAKDNINPSLMKYICVLHDEIASLEFA